MITYLVGDATSPIGEGGKLICHISNDLGGWGAGFVLAISKKWKRPEIVYRSISDLVLGTIQPIRVEKDIMVINMIAQHGIGIDNVTKIPPIRYDALRECLKKVNNVAEELNATVHAPRFGAGLAGGDWSIIEQIIKEEISVDVYIYDLK